MKGDSEKILTAAASALREWYSGSVTLDDCVEHVRAAEPEAARSVASILFEYFRHKELVDSLLMRSVSRGIKPELKMIGLCALTQALFQTAIAGESAVNIAVDVVKHSKKHRMASGFMNAVLRNALRSAGKGPFEPSFPPEIRRRWEAQFGQEATEQAVAACGVNPPLTFRLRSGELPAELAESVPVELDFANDFRFFECSDPGKLFASDAFKNGAVYIQDPATAMSVSLCRPAVRGRVLDSCAAPGGKTVMLFDACGGNADFTAADRSAARLKPMRENFTRLGLESVKTAEADAVHPPFDAESFDLVFLDVPCSNTGVPRRRPDALRRFDAKRLNEVAALQKQILNAQIRLVKPGGHLLYSTCSVEPEEDEQQVSAFLAAHPECELISQRCLLPAVHHDGAFAALIRKNG